MTRSRGYRPRNMHRGDPLTARELQVLALVSAGETTPVISRRLGIVENTIKSHLTSIYKKTGCANRVQAARYYLLHYTSPATAPAAGEDGGASLIAEQILQIQARLEQLAPAASEARRLHDAVEALRQIQPN
jgi:DNA-binding CsgD family transcriptional regulator